jgi:hypothetical protein
MIMEIPQSLLPLLTNEMKESNELFGSYEINNENSNRYRIDLVDAGYNKAGNKTLRLALSYLIDRRGNAQPFNASNAGKAGNWVTLRSASISLEDFAKVATFSNVSDSAKVMEALETYHQYWEENANEMYATLANSRAWFGIDTEDSFVIFDFTVFDGTKVNSNGKLTIGLTNVGVNNVRLSNPRGFSLGLPGGTGLAQRTRLPRTEVF